MTLSHDVEQAASKYKVLFKPNSLLYLGILPQQKLSHSWVSNVDLLLVLPALSFRDKCSVRM